MVNENIEEFVNTESSELLKPEECVDLELGDKKRQFLQEFLERLKELKWVHVRSAQYYEKCNRWIVAPSILITTVSGIAAFMSTSKVVSEDVKTGFNISVGILASCSSLLQSFSSSFKFSTKSEMHRTAAEGYQKLMIKIRFELSDPNEEDFIQKIESKILEIQGNCKYFPPQFICDEYELEHKKDKEI